MNKDKSHIIPFPLPEHLCLFLSERLETPIETIGGVVKAKALHVSSLRPLGKFVLTTLKKSNTFIKPKDGITMYISVSGNAGMYSDNVVECRNTLVTISDECIKDIADLFEDMFRMNLVAFLDGTRYGSDYKKGKFKDALVEFLQKYNLAGCDKTFEKYRKHYFRLQNNSKTLIFK